MSTWHVRLQTTQVVCKFHVVTTRRSFICFENKKVDFSSGHISKFHSITLQETLDEGDNKNKRNQYVSMTDALLKLKFHFRTEMDLVLYLDGKLVKCR